MNEDDQQYQAVAESITEAAAEPETAHAEANTVLADKMSTTVAQPVTTGAGYGRVDGLGSSHPGHVIIDEILRALHVQNPGPWLRNKLEELRKTL